MNTIKLNHTILFYLGWFYYTALPIVFAYSTCCEDIDSLRVWFEYISTQVNYYMIGYVIAIPLFFKIGDFLSQFGFKYLPRTKLPRTRSLKLANWIVLPIYCLFLVFYFFFTPEVFFTGYTGGIDAAAAGPISTLEMLYLFHYLVCIPDKNRAASHLTGFFLLITSIILIGMGGRLYVLSTIISIAFYHWNWVPMKAIIRRRLFISIMLLPILLVAVGMWRVGDSNFTTVGFYLFAEPLFASISSFTLLQHSNWQWLSYPNDFIVSILNIVPSILWPDKSLVLSTLTKVNPTIEAPFGAVGIIASSVDTFGLFGGLCFISIVGFVMGHVRKSASVPLMKAMYSVLAGLLPFMFFRDPYLVQVKVVFTVFLLVLLYRMLSSFKFSKNSKVI